jgi:hypothetical protein
MRIFSSAKVVAAAEAKEAAAAVEALHQVALPAAPHLVLRLVHLAHLVHLPQAHHHLEGKLSSITFDVKVTVANLQRTGVDHPPLVPAVPRRQAAALNPPMVVVATHITEAAQRHHIQLVRGVQAASYLVS